MSENNVIKYPHDLVSFVRQKTLSIESRLSSKNEGEESPRQTLKDFSVFKFTAIANGKAVSGNLKPGPDFTKVKTKTAFASCKHEEYLFECENAKNAGNNTPAFTERFKAGFLKGKSPIDVLLEKGKEEGGKVLNEQYQFLQKSSKENPKFAPANKKLMDAIVEASKVDLEALKNVELPTAPAPILIFDSGVKGSMKSKTKKREDGKFLCYQMTITWDVTKDYPVTVSIENFYAPIVPSETNGQIIKISEKDTATAVKNDFALTASEWEYAVEEMKEDLNLFRMFHYKEGVQRAERAANTNKGQASA